MIIVVVFLFSFGGFLAAWAGYFVPSGPDDYGNTILFTLLANSVGASTPVVNFVLLAHFGIFWLCSLHDIIFCNLYCLIG